jgi:acyl-CoA thioester hydrolase
VPEQIFTTPVSVRFKDIDALGHVNNAVIITYFEEGRKAFFLDHFDDGDPNAFNFILARMECDFLEPVRLAHTPLVKLWVSAIGQTSFGFVYKLVDSQNTSTIFARGRSVQVCYDYTHRAKTAVPAMMRQILSPYLAENA